MKHPNQRKAGVVLSYMTIAVNALVTLFYTPLLLRILGQNEYGLYTLVSGVVGFLSLFQFGGSGAYIRFYTQTKKNGDEAALARLNGTFLGIFLLLGVLAGVCGCAMTLHSDALFGAGLTAEELATAKLLAGMMVLNLVLTFPNTVFNAVIAAQEQYIFQRLVTLAITLLGPCMTLPLLLLGGKSEAVVLVSILLAAGQTAVNGIYCVRALHTRFSLADIDPVLIRQIFSFSFFIFLNVIIDQINWNVDKFLLGRFHGTAEVAVYGVAAQVNSIFITFSTAVSSVFAPRIHSLIAEWRMRELDGLFVRVGRIQLMIIALFASGFLFFGREAITLWAGTGYEAAYVTALLLIFPTLVPLVQNLGIEIQRAQNKHRFRSVAYMIIAVLNVLISIPLGRRYGSIGCAFGTALSMLLGNGLIMNWYYYCCMGLDIRAFWKSLASVLPSFVLPVVLGTAMMLFVPFDSLAVYILCIVLYSLTYLASLCIFGMNAEEKEQVQTLLRRKKETKL